MVMSHVVGARVPRMVGIAAIAALGGCQAVSGLDELHGKTSENAPATTTAKTTSTSTTSGTTTGGHGGMGHGGMGPGGQGAGGGADCPDPAPGACVPPGQPESCAGTCQGNTCQVVCKGIPTDPPSCSTANGKPINCGPPNLASPCELHCRGTACAQHTVRCGQDQSCSVLCEGPGACLGTEIYCPDAALSCSVTCTDGACDATTTTLYLGHGKTTATCELAARLKVVPPGGGTACAQDTSSCTKP